MNSDPASFEQRRYMNDEVSRILQALNEARVKYAVWGSAACVYHGGRWLWKCLDYEVMIDDWSDGLKMQTAVESITAHCNLSWTYDHKFDPLAWATARGDRPPLRPIRRFVHTSHQSRFGVLLVPAASTYIASMHHDDLVNDESEPTWIYPSLKNFVESQLLLWRLGGRNSSLIELTDLVAGRRLDEQWQDEVGLNLRSDKRHGRPDLPSDAEVWQEILRMRLSQADPQRATSRFMSRRAERAQNDVQATTMMDSDSFDTGT